MAGFDELTLRTERLVLRPLHSADAAALLAIFSDPRVMRYWSTPPWSGLEQAQAFVERDLESMRAGADLRLGLERRSDARLIGQCTLHDIVPASRRAQIGYSMDADAWGRGYMHEALCALLDHGFGALALNRVEADIDPRNAASARSLERLGFTREGLLRERWIVDGEVSDTGLGHGAVRFAGARLVRPAWITPGRWRWPARARRPRRPRSSPGTTRWRSGSWPMRRRFWARRARRWPRASSAWPNWRARPSSAMPRPASATRPMRCSRPMSSCCSRCSAKRCKTSASGFELGANGELPYALPHYPIGRVIVVGLPPGIR